MITVEEFGTIFGCPVKKFKLEKAGIEAEIINYGATVTSVRVPDKNGDMTDVVLGYRSVEEYDRYDGYLGASIGRVANRIGGAAFNYGGVDYKLFNNDNGNTLHGGKEGFNKKIWNADVVGESVVMTYVSEDGEEGFFGRLEVEAEFFIDSERGLNIVYTAVTDSESAVNLTNHTYFNLNGEGSGTVLGHLMEIKSSCITPIDKALIPYGEFLDVAGTPFDFTSPKAVGRDVEAVNDQLSFAGGYDHNFVLDQKDGSLAAITVGDKSGIVMRTETNQFGLQFYGGNFLTLRMGKSGKLYDKRDAFCLEAQAFPNALNVSAYGSPVIRSGEVYRNEIVYRFPPIKGDN